jgi:Brp/Blh family beta-carotene 15,15'-monooxygenase
MFIPLVTSAGLLGLPHGAVDYVLAPRAVGDDLTWRWLVAVGLLYLVLGGGYAWLWFIAPIPAAILFVLLTWFHWGQGDRYHIVSHYGGGYAVGSATGWLTVLVRGGIPMLVPLVAFPEQYRAVLESFIAVFGTGFGEWPVAGFVRLVVGAGFAVLTVGTLALARMHSSNHRAWRLDAVETCLLWGYFLIVPSILAIGVYFTLWHSTRHISRALGLDAASVTALESGDYWTPIVRFTRDALLPTVAAFALIAGLWIVAPNPSPSIEGVVAVYLVVIAALTLPHTIVITWLDYVQKVL